MGTNTVIPSFVSIAGSGGAGILSTINGANLYFCGGGGGACGADIDYPITCGNGGIGGGGAGGAYLNSSGTRTAGTGGGSALNSGGNTNLSTGAGGAGGTNTGGGGGGGGSNSVGASGGSGIIIIRYLGSQRGTGGNVTSSGGYTIHTFTSSTTYTA